jgi:N-acetylneuraminic acid mutarotase
LWVYNTTTNTWKEVPTHVPIKARASASACVVGDCAYIGLGFEGKAQRDSSYLRDFWQYNFKTLKWKRLADFPANTTVKNCLFATEQAIYATYGFNREFTQDAYRYDLEKDTWEKLDVSASPNVPRAMDIVGATCQERHFVGTGFNHGSLRFWAEWIPSEQKFVPCQKILGAGRNAAACCATEDYVYIAGGRHYGDTLTTGFFYSSIQRYSPEQDQWEYVGSMPYEAENMVMTYIKGQIFIGLGENKDGIIQGNWYSFEE